MGEQGIKVDEWLRSYRAGEGKRWTNEVIWQMGGGD